MILRNRRTGVSGYGPTQRHVVGLPSFKITARGDPAFVVRSTRQRGRSVFGGCSSAFPSAWQDPSEAAIEISSIRHVPIQYTRLPGIGHDRQLQIVALPRSHRLLINPSLSSPSPSAAQPNVETSAAFGDWNSMVTFSWPRGIVDELQIGCCLRTRRGELAMSH